VVPEVQDSTAGSSGAGARRSCFRSPSNDRQPVASCPSPESSSTRMTPPPRSRAAGDWDTPTWLLPRELRAFYAAVNRLHQLEAKSGASPAEIAAARHAVGVAGFNWCGASMRCGTSKRSEQLCVTRPGRPIRGASIRSTLRGTGLQSTLRWREMDSNPRSP
jgi:hypothetical protein